MAPGRLQDQIAYPPRGLKATRAAAYLGMSEAMFLGLVEQGVMPKPKRIAGLEIWDRFELDAAFEKLETRSGNRFDRMMGLDK